MKKYVSLFIATCFIGCSDNSEHPQDKSKQFEGFFTGRKVTMTREPGPVAWKSGLMIEKKSEMVILLRIQDGVYHEYQITTVNNGTPLLVEKTYEYTQKSNGTYEILQVADTCGELRTSSLYDTQQFKPASTERSMQTVDGLMVQRISEKEFVNLATQVEVNKEKDLYKKDCNNTARQIQNTSASWWDWIF